MRDVMLENGNTKFVQLVESIWVFTTFKAKRFLLNTSDGHMNTIH